MWHGECVNNPWSSFISSVSNCSKQYSSVKFENKLKFSLGVGFRAVGRPSIKCVEHTNTFFGKLWAEWHDAGAIFVGNVIKLPAY